MTATDSAPPDWAAELRRERQAIVRQLRRNRGNRVLTARELGVSKQLVEKLAALHGIPPFDRVGQGHITTATETGRARKAAVLDALRTNGGNVKRAARETGVPESTVREWKKRC